MREWPLVGRTAVLRQIRELLTGPSRRSVVVVGPMGVGKTRLVGEALKLVDRAGLATARISATRASMDIPLGAFAPLLPHVGEAAAGAVDDRGYLLRKCEAALLQDAGGKQLILFVDDAHLLDDMSATLIYQLADTARALIVATVRSFEPAPDGVLALWKDSLAERIELSGLTDEAVGEALSWALGGPVDDAAVARLVERAQGNVLFLRELVTGAVADNTLCDDGGIWRLVGDLHPTHRLIELVEDRLRGLCGEDRAMMELVSFGEPLKLPELERLGSIDVVERLERVGLLQSRMTGRAVAVGLAHPVYGDVLRSRTTPLQARSIARKLAEAIESVGTPEGEDILRLATWRLAGGGAAPDLMVSAALQARWRYDFSLAERLAIEALEAGAGFEAKLLVAQLAGLMGRSDEASQALDVLLVEADKTQCGQIALVRLDNRYIYDGTIDEGLRIADESLETLSDLPIADEIAARRVALVLAKSGPAAAVDAAAPLLANASGRALVWACMPAAYSLARAGRIADALAAAETGLCEQLGLSAPMDWYPWMHRFYEAEALAHAGRFLEAEQVSVAQYQSGLAGQSTEAQGLFSWQLSKTVADRGGVEDAVRRAQMAAAIYRRLNRPQFVQFALLYLALALSIGRRHAEASDVLASIDRLGLQPGHFMGVDPLHTRGWCSVAGGDLRAAAATFREAADVGEACGDLVGAAAALHSLARIGHARDVAARLAVIVEGIEGDLAAARSAHVTALAESDAAGLDAVSERFESMGAVLLAAEASADAAVAWRGAGHRRNAAASHRRATWVSTRCRGADTPALRSLGARVHLTAAEAEAAELAAAGRSNKEIAAGLCVSVRTVENRLHDIYAKLGVSGRTGLQDALSTLQRDQREFEDTSTLEASAGARAVRH